MFDALFNLIEGIALGNITNMVGLFIDIITPLLGACVTTYVLYFVYQMLYNAQSAPFLEIISMLLSLSLVTAIGLSSSWYLGNVVPAVLTAGDEIARGLLGGGHGASGSLQNIFDVMIERIGAMFSEIDLSITSPSSWIHAALMFFEVVIVSAGFIAFLCVSTAYLFVAKIMVSFLLILGPMFIMMAFFPSTRAFFQAWTGQCFNYILLNVLYPLAFTVFTQAIEVTVLNGQLSFANAFMSAIILFALVVVSLHIPTLSSALSGGVGINGLVGSGMQALRAMKNAAKGAGKAGRGLGKIASRLFKGKVGGA